ncbi:MAG: HAD-IIB family hydrolase [bacterium]|nr:HAD-IIB family hydrolase [bacterium]
MKKEWKNKKLFVFDLDKTLAESKQPMDDEMADLLRLFLQSVKIAVISGGSFAQYDRQFVPKLSEGNLDNLFLFPTCGSSFYRQENGEWRNVYTETLLDNEKKDIFAAFDSMFLDVGFSIPEVVYGELVEDRGAQVTFSAFGATAPLSVKGGWDPDRKKRLKMIEVLKKYLPELEIRTGGTSSIDVTRKGIDKAYGIAQMEKHIGISRKDMAFVGDDFEEGGNDHPIISTGVEYVHVKNPSQTKELLKSLMGL